MTTIIDLSAPHTITVGVVADTHIPDRVKSLHPDLLAGLAARSVDYIFHAGDISTLGVLEELASVAPVFAVAGNRDLLNWKTLPLHRQFIINGARVLLTHGHVNLFYYWFDKAQHFLQNYQLDRYVNRLMPLARAADVFIFGHSHHAANRMVNGKLFYNPGSASIAIRPESRISFGIIRFEPGGAMTGEVIDLSGSVVRFGKWVTEV